MKVRACLDEAGVSSPLRQAVRELLAAIPDDLPDGAVVPEAGAVASETGAVVPEARAVAPKTGAAVPEAEAVAPGTGAVVPKTGDDFEGDATMHPVAGPLEAAALGPTTQEPPSRRKSPASTTGVIAPPRAKRARGPGGTDPTKQATLNVVRPGSGT